MTTSTSADRYAHEEVRSTYGYPNGYKPRDISEQVTRLRELFPHLGSVNEAIVGQWLPEGAEGWFAVPRWQNIAGTYNAAVEAVLAKLASTRPFYNWREGQLGPDRLRQSERSSHALDVLAEQQNGADILIVAAQSGKRHAGRSVRRAREVFSPNEFGLGAFGNAVMLLTHPERLQHVNDLWIDCAGDEYSDDGQFDYAPYFDFLDGELKFDTSWSAHAIANYGSASGFLPQ